MLISAVAKEHPQQAQEAHCENLIFASDNELAQCHLEPCGRFGADVKRYSPNTYSVELRSAYYINCGLLAFFVCTLWMALGNLPEIMEMDV